MQIPTLLNDNKATRLLIAPEFRKWRYLLFLPFIALISANAGVYTHMANGSISIGATIIEGAILFAVYLGMMHINLSLLVPRWLEKNNYLGYIGAVTGLSIGIVLFNIVTEYLILEYLPAEPGVYSYFHPDRPVLLVLFTEFFAMSICIAGTTLPFLLRQWIVDGNRKNDLEKTTLRQQSEEIRNRVSPSLLFGILDSAAGSVRTEPEKTSAILMKISRFLRYQLYDSSREWVFLNSEIAFLDNYLQLESVCRNLTYQLRVTDNDSRIPVAPMLFFQVVRSMIESIGPEQNDARIELLIEPGPADISMTGTVNALPQSDTCGRERIRNRLELFYPGKYRYTETETADGFHVHFQIPVRQ